MGRRKSFEEQAAEAADPPGFRHDLSRPGPAPLAAREAAALPMGFDAARGDGLAALIDREIGQLRHLLYSLDEQLHDIVRFRDNTRMALARLGAR